MFVVMLAFELGALHPFTDVRNAEAQVATSTRPVATSTTIQAHNTVTSVVPKKPKPAQPKFIPIAEAHEFPEVAPPKPLPVKEPALSSPQSPIQTPSPQQESQSQPVQAPEPALDPKMQPETAIPSQNTNNVLFSDAFTEYTNGIITNEYVHWSPNDPNAHVSQKWEMTAGSLFAKNGTAWTGVPDSGTPPNAESSNATNSGIFRLTTTQSNFRNVKVSFDLNTHALTSTAHTPAVAWDGVHIFLRYQSQYHLYYASINRRDNSVIIKKKVPGGPSNGGTYYNLSTNNPYNFSFDSWQKVEATIRDNADGSVTIQLFGNGTLVATATDKGTGGEPIRNGGKVGIRADNAEIQFKNFVVSAL